MRQIDFIVLHCTATQPTARVEAIERYWREVRGWTNPGYHFLVAADGTLHKLLPVEQIANGVRGLNHRSVHVSYIGGVDMYGRPKDTRTGLQKATTLRVLQALLVQFPQARVAGHYQFAAKACPSFDVPAWLQAMGIAEDRIYQTGKEPRP